MFDIGFSELVIIAVVGLLVIGPERLPEAVRTGSAWLGRLKRGFDEIKQEVKQELHNDAVMQELNRTSEQIKDSAAGLDKDIRAVADKVAEAVAIEEPEQQTVDTAPRKGAE